MDHEIVIVSFSSRKSGNCEQICDYSAKNMGKTAKTYHFSDFTIEPCGKCRYECFREGLPCPKREDMVETILRDICISQAAVFVLPNYNQFPNANFFAFQERCQSFFRNQAQWDRYLAVPKRFIVLSNTGKVNFVRALSQHTIRKPEILFLSARRYGKSCITESILESSQAKADILEFLQELPWGSVQPL